MTTNTKMSIKKIEKKTKEDSYYYGEIPDGVTRDSLGRIMACGILKYCKESGNLIKEDLCKNIVDCWLEHDADRDNKFDFLVEEDDEEFFEYVWALVKKS